MKLDVPLETADIIAEKTELDAEIAVLDAEITPLKRRLGRLWRRSKALREELIRRSYLVGCPKCGVDAELPCRDMRRGYDGNKAWPHAERIDAFAAQVGAESGLGIGFEER